jgi:hypothetical protein
MHGDSTWRSERRTTLCFEPLDERHLLSADLVAHWSADQLGASLRDGDVIRSWVDTIGGRVAVATGTPQWQANALGARAAIRFDPSDGADYLVLPAAQSPLANATDFSVTVAFATEGLPAFGGQGPWYANTGLVDANAASFRRDWGVSINPAGQASAGVGNGVLGQGHTLYSTDSGLADGGLHVVTFTQQAGTLTLYVNEQPATMITQVDSQPRDEIAIHLGALTNGEKPFAGHLAEVRLYDGALLAADVLASHREVFAPIAGEDSYFISPGQALSMDAARGVLHNDRGVGDRAITATLVSPPTRGSLSFLPDGSFTYTPSAGFQNGTDRFSYRAQSGTSASAEIDVFLIINSAADQQNIVINELHVNSAEPTEFVEFVELHNMGDVAVSLANWRLGGGVTATFPPESYIPAGGFFVIAEDPEAFATKYAVTANAQYTGRLSNDGELIELRSNTGTLIDQVDYGTGFPWPTVGADPGYSMELLNPTLDNDLAGSWRLSVGQQEIVRQGDSWQFFKGTEAPANGTAAWRLADFNDSSWSVGTGPFGFSTRLTMGTTLTDMRNGYSSLYLRKSIQVEDPGAVRRLGLQALYDDGFNLWINGVHLVRENLASNEMPFDAIADSSKSNTSYQEFELPDPASYLVAGENIIAVQLLNSTLSNSDAYFDAVLVDLDRPSAGPTPGMRNSMLSSAAPPQLRQVNHSPQQPTSQDDVRITVKATDPDGMGLVTLDYQIVAPGQYARLTDAAYANWTRLPMFDDGTRGDETAGDDIYTAVLPASLQEHRHLIRYRIHAADRLGDTVSVPYADDTQPNFAYFVYDGVSAWTAADRPGATDPVTFGTDVMNQLPVYHLIANSDDVTRSQYVSSAEEQLFYGTFVYDGVVYDHIQFGVRGEFSTYVSGKNKWKFHFNRGHEFQARDNYGRPYGATWRIMNFSPAATPWVEMNRGMAGIDEAIAYRLYDLAGNPSPNTNFLQFRVIDDAPEATASQYDGDLWGLYLSLEHPDGRFLDARDLPDGTTYKVENAQGDIKHQGSTQPDATRNFRDMMAGASRVNTEEWWRENIDLDVFFDFRAINRAINNMDIRDGWNHYIYHNSETGKWETIPWDLDMLWVPTTHWSGVIRFENALRHESIAIEYANRARELQDLLFSPDQVNQLVDEYAGFVNPPGVELTMSDVDRFMWNYHPRASTSGDDIHRGAFHKQSADYDRFIGPNGVRRLVSGDHEGMAQWIKDFLLPAPGGGSTPAGYGANQLDQHVQDASVPHRPTIQYVGAANFAADGLVFRTSDFADPDAGDSFAALEWRLARVTDPSAPKYDPAAPPDYEIRAVWESGEMTEFRDRVEIPTSAVEVGQAYRVRVRMKDASGRYSHWSEPIQFIATAGTPTDLLAGLRISEVHYNPGAPSPAELAAGFTDKDDFEFVELVNAGSVELDLRSVQLVESTTPTGEMAGVTFNFSESSITTLAPGQRLVVVEDLDAFRARYGAAIPVAGQWTGRLDNRAEPLTLTAAGVTIQQFTYSDAWYPATDGQGRSLEVVDIRETDLSRWNSREGWRSSEIVGGSPGTDGQPRIPGDVNGDGLFNSTDLVLVFQSGHYERLVGVSRFEDGDWNGDGKFNSGDLVYAFTFSTYVP